MSSTEFVDAAIQVALRRMYISSPDKVDKNRCFQKSGGPKGLFILCNSEGKKIASIDNASIEEQLAGVGPSITPVKKAPLAVKAPIANSPSSTSDFPLSNDAAAVAWAKSIGYPVPQKMGGCLSAFLIVAGLCIFIVPGVLLLVFVFIQKRTYERDMKALVIKWVDAGKPMPGQKVRPVEKLERIKETTVERIKETKDDVITSESNKSSTEEKLEELSSMKEKELISQEEYDILRKKALGL